MPRKEINQETHQAYLWIANTEALENYAVKLSEQVSPGMWKREMANMMNNVFMMCDDIVRFPPSVSDMFLFHVDKIDWDYIVEAYYAD